MLEVMLTINVKPEYVEQFKEVLHEDALASLQEPGCIAFDVLQDIDEPTCFILHEQYRHARGWDEHTATPHYIKALGAVEAMQSTPRQVRRCRRVVGEIQDFEAYRMS